MTLCRLDTIDLDDEAHWDDELSWSPRREQVEPSVLGSLLVDESSVTEGRPITLVNLFLHRDTVEALRALADTMNSGPHTLTLPDARTYQVYWRVAEGALVAIPTKRRPAYSGVHDAYYFCTLRFRTVSL